MAKIPGCARPSPGLPAISCWAASRIWAEILKQRNKLCAVADVAVVKLRDRKVPGVPSKKAWGNLSCDQKAAFLVALGPAMGIVGPALLVAGAVGAAIRSKEVKQLERGISNAAESVGGAVKSAVKDAVSSAGESAKKFGKKVGIGEIDPNTRVQIEEI